MKTKPTQDGLTNTQIIAAHGGLTPLQKQVRFLIQHGMRRKPCPNCGELHNLPEASGVEFDEYDFGKSISDRKGPCRCCNRTLIFTLPLFGDWHWRLDPEEASAA